MIEPTTRADTPAIVRLRPSMHDWLNQLASEMDISKSMVIRLAIAYAADQPALFATWCVQEGVVKDTMGASVPYTPNVSSKRRMNR